MHGRGQMDKAHGGLPIRRRIFEAMPMFRHSIRNTGNYFAHFFFPHHRHLNTERYIFAVELQTDHIFCIFSLVHWKRWIHFQLVKIILLAKNWLVIFISLVLIGLAVTGHLKVHRGRWCRCRVASLFISFLSIEMPGIGPKNRVNQPF